MTSTRDAPFTAVVRFVFLSKASVSMSAYFRKAVGIQEVRMRRKCALKERNKQPPATGEADENLL